MSKKDRLNKMFPSDRPTEEIDVDVDIEPATVPDRPAVNRPLPPSLGVQLESVVTPITPTALATALVAAWRKEFGYAPKRETILVLLAQSALETGRWKSLRCYNLGNVKCSAGDGRDYQFFRCNEVVNGKTVWFDPPDPVCRFRAFRTLEDGAADHLAFLSGLKRYADAWQHVQAGDPAAFVQALSAGGYFTAPIEPYMRSVRALFAEFARLPFQVEDDSPPDTVDPARVAIRMGSRGAAVAAWQAVLGIKTDGQFGPVTMAATKQWQAAHGIEPDGVVSASTWALVPPSSRNA